MILPQAELFAIVARYNPWWDRRPVPELPKWNRVAFDELRLWLTHPPAPRAVLLSGARQVGKTTLLLQAIQSLLSGGTPPERILYATFDHPILKLIGLEGLLRAWREMHPPGEGTEYLLLDEIQYCKDWQIWLKHQVDFEKGRRIAATGSAIPLNYESPESGVGRWHTIRLPTLSFYEYLRIKNIDVPNLPRPASLAEIFTWSSTERNRVVAMAQSLVAHFHDYLLRGGFPQTALVDSIPVAQKLLREDIVDKVLKRDISALYGVRRVLDLEKLFLYLCLHDGGILDMQSLSSNIGVTKPTASSYLDVLEAAHLIHKLPPFGYGKEVFRARYKVYLADAAIAGSVLLRGKSLIEDSTRLGAAVETAFFKHVMTRYASTSTGLWYWRSRQGHEVDLVADIQGEIVPFEVKYSRSSVQPQDVTGLLRLCQEREIPRAYIITRDISDFSLLCLSDPENSAPGHAEKTSMLKIPAPLACFWLSASESA